MSSGVPVYHSVYDNLTWYQKFADPNFVAGPTMATFNGILALRFANAPLIPYSITQYATDFKSHLETLSKRAQTLNVPFDTTPFEQPIQTLLQVSTEFSIQCEAQNRSANTLQNINQKLIHLERTWLHPQGLQERPWSRSLFGSEDPFTGYAPWMLPGLQWEIEHKNETPLKTWSDIYLKALSNLENQVQNMVNLCIE